MYFKEAPLAFDDPAVLHDDMMVQRDFCQMSRLRRGPGWGRSGAVSVQGGIQDRES